MEDFRKLLDKYSNGTCTPQELKELLTYVREHGSDGELEELIANEIGKDDMPDVLPEYLNEISARNQEALANRIQGTAGKRVIRFNKWLAAAGIIFLLSACFLIYKLLSKDPATPQGAPQTAQADILPATDRAILTLSDGRKISLDDDSKGALISEGNLSISKSGAGELVYTIKGSKNEEPYTHTYNTLSTPNGGRYKIALPDGTLVWLNAGSSLTYPLHFAKHERRVRLTGEAYFEVAKGDAGQPFIVESKTQQVQVLGTHFNINAYQNEPSVRTTLAEGKVKVISGDAVRILNPGEQSRFNGSSLSVAKVDIEEFTAWKDNLFVFRDAGLAEILRQVERWYDVQFKYEKLPSGIKMYGELPRDIELSGLLTTLEKNTGLKFTLKGRRIMVAQ